MLFSLCFFLCDSKAVYEDPLCRTTHEHGKRNTTHQNRSDAYLQFRCSAPRSKGALWTTRTRSMSPEMAMTDAFWHFARGSAFAAKGQIAHAEAERQILATASQGNTTPTPYTIHIWGIRSCTHLIRHLLESVGQCICRDRQIL